MVVDTSAWIEWLRGSATGQALGAHLPERSSWIVPTIVQLELTKWISREGNPDAADQVIALTQMCLVMPLWTSTAVAAAEYALAVRLPIADAIVYATARSLGAKVLTCDAHFEALEGVIYVTKRT